MQTIHVVLDKPLLEAADRRARKMKVNRSALMRAALRQENLLELERRDREGYERHPLADDSAAVWEQVGQWPDD